MERYISLWINSLPQLLIAALQVTVPLSAIAFVLALVLGVIAAGARASSFKPVSWLAWLYIWAFRGTPLLVQLFIVFYGLPKLGLTLNVWTAAIITLTLNTGAYVAESFRAAVSSIPRGQFEAARTLNFDIDGGSVSDRAADRFTYLRAVGHVHRGCDHLPHHFHGALVGAKLP